MKGKSQLFSDKGLIFASILVILIWVAPYFILGQNAHMRVHDNLDSNIAWYKILNDSGELYGSLDAHIPQIINGQLSRNAFYSQFYGIVILFHLFPPMMAYGLSQLLTRGFAFLGMSLFLKKYVIKSKLKLGWIPIVVSLAFALTPYWPNGMLSILGMPLAFWAFLNIRGGEKSWKNWLTITLLPLYSSFILGFFFFLSAMGIFWLVDSIKRKKVQLRFFIYIVYMTLLYLLIEYRDVVSLLLPHEKTNRSEFLESKLSLHSTIHLIFKNYLLGHNQDQAVFTPIILILSLIALLIIILKKDWRKERGFIYLHVFNFLLSVWYAFWFYKGWQPIKDQVSILNTFNFSRYHYFHPMVQYILLALSLKIIFEKGRVWRKFAVVGLLAQLLLLIPYNEQIYYHNSPTYKQYFAVNEFSKIKDYIGKPPSTYRVVSIGMHPDIAQYNGLYTLDTYTNFYPLSYKHAFRKIIAPELAKNKNLAKYFDQWGGRCYVFVDELGKNYMFSKHSKKVIYHLKLNTSQLKAMGGQYVLSAVPIQNASANQLTFEKAFTDSNAYWKIYLYKVK